MTESRDDDFRAAPPPSNSAPKAALSPSLRAASTPSKPSFELKFVIAEDRAAEIEEWARMLLDADPHGDRPGSGRYATTTLYLDTVDFATYHRTSDTARKFRVRRYDAVDAIYLEIKERRADRVTKQRWPTATDWRARLERCERGEPVDGSIEFERECGDRALRPTCVVRYTRTAFFAPADAASPRLTIDREIRGARVTDYRLDEDSGDAVTPLADVCICELKFSGALPMVFRDVITRFGLRAATASKYRATMARILGPTT